MKENVKTLLKAINEKDNISKKMRKNARIAAMWNQEDDILRWNLHLQKLEHNNISVSKWIRDAIRFKLDYDEKKQGFKTFKNDLFYAILKANYSSNTPMFKNIKQIFHKMEFEFAQIHQKLNLLNNAIYNEVNIDEVSLDYPSTEAIKDSEFFDKNRTSFILANDQIQKDLTAKMKQAAKSFNNFAETDVFNDDLQEPNDEQ